MNLQMRRILKLFTGFRESGRFYLAGGTALAEFHLHHRISFDLDLFLPFQDRKRGAVNVLALSQNLADSLKGQGHEIEWFQRHSHCGEMGIYHGKEKTRVTLAYDTAHLLHPPKKKWMGVRIASFEDVAAGKLCAFHERMEHRDIIDVYYILKKMSPNRLIALAKRRWPHLDAYQTAKQFERVDAVLPSLGAFGGFLRDKKLKRDAVAAFYERESVKVMKGILAREPGKLHNQKPL